VTRLPFLGDRRALAELRPRLYRLAFAWCHDPALAEDLVQETLARALARGGQLRAQGALAGWLLAILSNCWRDHLRRTRDHGDLDDALEWPDAHGHGPEAACSQGQVVERVRRAVARLPVGQRQVLTLVDLEECSYAEVAQVLGIPVGTVMSRLARARAALRRDLVRPEPAADPRALRSVR
jgi:RNA polymerase sigma-70 factor (ECF subfamily)